MVGAMLNVLLFSLGSSGDLFPFVGLGKTLLRRGHRVRLAANPAHRQAVESAGLELLPLGTEDDYRAAIDSPLLWHTYRSGELVAALAGKAVKQTVEHIRQFNEPGNTVVGASSLCFGARVAEDAWQIPTATIHLQPAVMLSCISPGVFAGVPRAKWLPPLFWKAIFRLADVIWDKGCRQSVNEARTTLGLPPASRMLTRYMNSPRCVIGMWPEWFAPPASDWPAQATLAGFSYYDGESDGGLDPALEAFLSTGAPPVCVSLGSANKQGAADYAKAISAISRLGRRGLILTLHPEQLPEPLPPGFAHFKYAPFSRVLPRCAALIHHGGVGTTAQALRAGCPQIILAMTHDQPDNADRAHMLGVAAALRRGASQGRLERELRKLLGDPAVERSAREVASRAQEEDGLAHVAEILETLVKPIPPSRQSQ
jgi:rhamnosyltransferase subunit B